MIVFTGFVDSIQCSSEDIVPRGIVIAVFQVSIEYGKQGIVFGVYTSLALMLDYRDKEWVPDIMYFTDYLNRIWSSRDGLVVFWKNRGSSHRKGVNSVFNWCRNGANILDLLEVKTKSNPGKLRDSSDP